jgi:hypothetical protein
MNVARTPWRRAASTTTRRSSTALSPASTGSDGSRFTSNWPSPYSAWLDSTPVDGSTPSRPACENPAVPENYFGERVAAQYDETSGDMFDAAVIGPTVEFLAGLAGG